jgi:WhiB family redox-sensing transcriptional regulator
MSAITLDSPAGLLLTLSDDERRATITRLRAELAYRRAHWRDLAACRGMDVRIFYGPEEIRGSPVPAAVAAAKRICRQCPVITECRLWALNRPEPYGIWGGLTTKERQRRRRPAR